MTREEQPTYPLIVPKGTPKPNFFVPKEFRNRVVLHVVKNYYTHDLNPPLILTIQGPKGEGKSSQTREVCSQMGAYVIPISGASLSGNHEGDALDELRNVYTYASSVRKSQRKFTVVLIDDFDLSVASVFTNREYTINTQLLIGFLMNLADEPTKCGDEYTHRIPFIFTGNNFTGLPGPLVRHGRMDFFDWKLTRDQKNQIVSAMYNESLPSDENYAATTSKTTSASNNSAIPVNQNSISALVKEFADQPISFFAALKSDFVDKVILATIEKDGRVNQASISLAITEMPSITVESLFELAHKRKLMHAKDYEICEGGKEVTKDEN